MQKTEFFHRDGLARRLAGELMSADGSSGLFVTGPRRTGKSTFIREDLIPILSKAQGSQVVYADLWEDRSADPGDVIVAAIRAELMKFDSLIIRAAKGETLTKALNMLAVASRKPVVLIIDEAQHTQTTDEGRQALYALKAARDALNASAGPGFRLLATGSSSDKLASLVEDKDQAFYQAPLMPLPTLGRDYLEWLNGRLTFDPRPSVDAMVRAFDACSRRPEPLRAVLRDLALLDATKAEEVDALFESMMTTSLAQAKASFQQQVNGLNPLDAAVLKVMGQEGKNFAPYTKGAYANYKALMLASTGEFPTDVTQSAVQLALERLRGDKFIWRAGRGAYLIEDTQHVAWINETIAQEREDIERARQEIQARAAALSIPNAGAGVTDANP